jgi:hypothetical protein
VCVSMGVSHQARESIPPDSSNRHRTEMYTGRTLCAGGSDIDGIVRGVVGSSGKPTVADVRSPRRVGNRSGSGG